MNNEHESFLIPFFEKMNIEYPEDWCVLHSYETLPYYSKSDVDMAFSGINSNNLDKIIIETALKSEWRVYQKLWYDSKKCNYYILKNNNTNSFLAIDFLVDNSAIGRYGFKTSLLTKNCNIFNKIVKIPNNEVAFCYKFVKRIIKKIPIIEDNEYLLTHYKLSNKSIINKIMKEQFGEEGLNIIKKKFISNSFLLDSRDIELLNKIKRKRFNRNIGKLIEKFYWESRRFLNRVFYPCGMIINTPKLSTTDRNKFKDTLDKKVSILFRFVKINKSNLIANNIKGLVGSTLVIREVNNFKKNRAIEIHWLGVRYTSEDSLMEEDWKNIDIVVEKYYLKILEILLKRRKFYEK